MANPKGLLIGGLLLFAVGTTLLVISLVLFPSVLTKVGNKAVLSNLIVDSSQSTRYDDWQGDASIENSYIQYYYMWNLTNPQQVINGGIPNYEQIGPINYKYEWTYENVSFIDSGNQVSYQQNKIYIYTSDGSVVDPTTTMITNINPAFYGLMSQLSVAAEEINAQFHGFVTFTVEELLFIIGSGGQMKYFLDYLSSPQSNFTELAYAVNSPKQFTIELNRLLNELGPNSIYTFLDGWANSTATGPTGAGNWTGMYLGEDTQISRESASQILNISNPMSILHSQAVNYWLSACFGNQTQSSILQSNLGITNSQLLQVCQWWLYDFSPKFTDSVLMEMCNVTSMTEVAYCQYLTAQPLGYKSISSFHYTQEPFALGAIEFTMVAQQNFTLPAMKLYEILFTGNLTLLNANNIGLFLNPSNASLWPLNNNDYAIVQEYILTMGQTYTRQTIMDQFYPTSGFIATRSMYDWLWNCSDPLLDFLGQGIDCSLQQNNTLEQLSTIYTGKSNSSMINQYIIYQGYSVVPYWNGTVPVEGVTESGQFAPGQSPDTLTLFEENTLRSIDLVYVEDSTVQGVDTKRYFLKNNSFSASPVFYSPVDGLTNMSSTLNPPLPIFISLWDMYEVPTDIVNKVQGQNPSFNLSGVPLDLEPITGNALYYNLKLQINFYIANDSLMFEPQTTYQNLTSDCYYPLFKVGQTGTPSSSTISTLKSQFKDLHILKLAPVIMAAIVGGILIVIGAIMAFFGYRRLRKVAGYEIIQ
ncbi:lysosomal integral membrane glycoprotein [Tieghemostelium lacteum]|uniref:Lysosomal integral membrane glycoprotein n=1 Tax=Tieghemostelium lacteum TaxID=361077 RepID=A0A152A2F7_TIELA|nr:lysosomal integral membrane glycoprotein [Tieghemostelium lacteum]|eukprot:KYR00251.1 lysosomal integral membrane glycoprotein [Tieghemostelium lacteum]